MTTTAVQVPVAPNSAAASGEATDTDDESESTRVSDAPRSARP
jgi:hypothetical protein